MNATRVDVVVVGAGVAGMRTALALAPARRVLLVDSGALASGSTSWAQGGLAAAVGPGDSPAAHAADTLVAGAGACREAVVTGVTGEAPALIGDLLALGARLDREEAGDLDLTLEGGHHRHRVAHRADSSGAEVSRVLVAAVRRTDVQVGENTSVSDLLVDRGRVVGLVLDGPGGREHIAAAAVVLATGGVGGLYERSTNPPGVTGIGLALALRAGATMRDLEFVQFHPTGLDVPGEGQVPLLTEALRGEGAVLVDAHDRRVMTGVHPLADLAPRDVVARAVENARREGPVYLDARGLGVDVLERRFPGVVAAAGSIGLHPARDPLPVVAAQHFLCGGVATDDRGATDVPGLYAVGEVAATGMHGANRLASNSLVEGAVLGRRLAERLAATLPEPGGEGVPTGATRASAAERGSVRRTLSSAAGVHRDGTGLAAAREVLSGLSSDEGLVAAALVEAASARDESRGCHWRDDVPGPPGPWTGHCEVRLGPDGRPRATAPVGVGMRAKALA